MQSVSNTNMNMQFEGTLSAPLKAMQQHAKDASMTCSTKASTEVPESFAARCDSARTHKASHANVSRKQSDVTQLTACSTPSASGNGSSFSSLENAFANCFQI